MLIAIKQFLVTHNPSSLMELSAQFNTAPEAMEAMLSHWVRKGYAVKEQAGCQKGCTSCAPEQLEMYRWKGQPAHIIPLVSIS